jgi:hypothetical protein
MSRQIPMFTKKIVKASAKEIFGFCSKDIMDSTV